MKENDVKELLYQQLQLLAEKSKECVPVKDGYYPGLIEYSKVMSEIADSYCCLKGITEETGLKMLNTLENIDATLKRIEQSLTAEKQHETIKSAVSHALLGKRYNPTSKNDE